MGLKLNIAWFNIKTEEFIGEEYSRDLGDDGSVIEKLGLPIEDNINNGALDVKKEWVPTLESYFKNKIETGGFD
ncbi:colicin E3-like toxin immunity protein [Photorhabdus luminescens]|uniref:colicin E3-like toxin immunity protein n=1 Tax=Photorhabdus luminescens TaxID=29488 RepID=UPI00223F30E4|nr:colicin E3-like toxin immunity protein [Photorhabdus luminescens]MCW7762258.1 cloacin immunity family protein [Photorhabdus luminescens subsp. venezuelensis]